MPATAMGRLHDEVREQREAAPIPQHGERRDRFVVHGREPDVGTAHRCARCRIDPYRGRRPGSDALLGLRIGTARPLLGRRPCTADAHRHGVACREALTSTICSACSQLLNDSSDGSSRDHAGTRPFMPQHVSQQDP
jgi:hypothetical protein